MAKSRKSSKKSAKPKAQYSLPAGFWAQVGAVALFAVALLLIFTWFNASGPVFESIHQFGQRVFGYGIYALPLVLLYLGIEIFRSEDSLLSPLAVLAGLILIILIGSLASVNSTEPMMTGGWVGGGFNKLILSLMIPGVAIFVYILAIAVTLIFMLHISPQLILAKMKDWREKTKSVTAEGFKPKSKSEEDGKLAANFQLVESVPTERNSSVRSVGGRDKSQANDFMGTAPVSPAEKNKPALVSVQDPNWKTPPVNLLGKKQSPADAGDVKHNAQVIKDTLKEFDIDVEMTGASVGPKVTQYTLLPPSGVKLTKIVALENNLAYNLAAQSLRIEAPIPGKRAVGIEVPNVKAADVRLRSILTSPEWENSTGKLTFGIGKNVIGDSVVENLSDLPHLLIAGQTGSGKSVMINSLLISLLYRNSPSDLKLILVDPKQVEMVPYEGIPHLLTPIINEPTQTISALKWAINEMERRYKLLAAERKRDIQSYNESLIQNGQTVSVEDADGNVQQHHDGKMPYIVIVIDELADLMMAASREVEALVVRIAQKARAVGIHLVLATQRPSVDVVTGLIKANIPARIAFTVASQVDSKTILDRAGAEKLLGKGDMLIITARMSKPIRLQGAWVSDEEVIKVTDFLREQMPPQYNDEVVAQEVQLSGRGGLMAGFVGGSDDDLVQQAIQVVLDDRKASTTLLQRRLKIGYARAARIMEELEERGVVGPQDGSRPREVLISSMDDLIG